MALVSGIVMLGGCIDIQPPEDINGDGTGGTTSDETHVPMEGVPQLTVAPTLSHTKVGPAAAVKLTIPFDTDTRAVSASISNGSLDMSKRYDDKISVDVANGQERVDMEFFVGTTAGDYKVHITLCNEILSDNGYGTLACMGNATQYTSSDTGFMQYSNADADAQYASDVTKGSTEFPNAVVTVDAAINTSFFSGFAVNLKNLSKLSDITGKVYVHDSTSNKVGEMEEFDYVSETVDTWRFINSSIKDAYENGETTIAPSRKELYSLAAGKYTYVIRDSSNFAFGEFEIVGDGQSFVEKETLLATNLGIKASLKDDFTTDGALICALHLPGTDAFKGAYVVATTGTSMTMTNGSMSTQASVSGAKVPFYDNYSVSCFVDMDGSADKSYSDDNFDVGPDAGEPYFTVNNITYDATNLQDGGYATINLGIVDFLVK